MRLWCQARETGECHLRRVSRHGEACRRSWPGCLLAAQRDWPPAPPQRAQPGSSPKPEQREVRGQGQGPSQVCCLLPCHLGLPVPSEGHVPGGRRTGRWSANVIFSALTL